MKIVVTFCMLFLSVSIYGNGIQVTNVSYNSNSNELNFTLEWENSWFISGNPSLIDAAWVFIKYAPNGGDTWHHAAILDSVPKSGYTQYISYDDLGIIIHKTTPGVGNFGPQEFTVELGSLLGAYQDFKVFATEMVFVDQGKFNAGDGSSDGRFYYGGVTNAPWNIVSEIAVERGNGAGLFNQEGSISDVDLTANFPKGYNSVFCMKYKITAQQYMDFLNCLTRTQQNNRVQANLTGITASNKYVMTDTPNMQDRNPIACDVNIGNGPITFFLDLDDSNPPSSPNDGANVVLNHLTPADINAYMDWSGLRPMTELEYEKFCRGEDMPAIANEYAWGTANYNASGSITNNGASNESTSNVGIQSSLFSLSALRAGYSATSTSSRTDASAAFYGIMDLHNLGEYMYGVESVNFSKLSYGDGELNANGNSNVMGWTLNPQLLSTQDPNAPAIEPISKGKTEITAMTRSANMGGRGVRRVIEF